MKQRQKAGCSLKQALTRQMNLSLATGDGLSLRRSVVRQVDYVALILKRVQHREFAPDIQLLPPLLELVATGAPAAVARKQFPPHHLADVCRALAGQLAVEKLASKSGRTNKRST